VWTSGDIEIELDETACEGSLITGTIATPAGTLMLIGIVERFDRELVVSRVHIQGMQANRLGWARLRQIARAVMEKLDVDVIVIKGAVRTTGAVRGRQPRPIRFSRAVPLAC